MLSSEELKIVGAKIAAGTASDQECLNFLGSLNSLVAEIRSDIAFRKNEKNS